MFNRIRRPLMWILAIQGVVYILGRFFEHKMSRGDETSDDFRVAAFCNGKDFRSRAEHLKSGSVVAGMGGVDIDLREATLSPEGATLDLNATLGGIQLTVPEEWLVEFDTDTDTAAGGFRADVKSPDDLPADAPHLRVHAVTRLGGASIVAEP